MSVPPARKPRETEDKPPETEDFYGETSGLASFIPWGGVLKTLSAR